MGFFGAIRRASFGNDTGDCEVNRASGNMVGSPRSFGGDSFFGNRMPPLTNSSVIPYSSGEVLTLTAPGNSGQGSCSAVGFGSTDNGIPINTDGDITPSSPTIACVLPVCSRFDILSVFFTNTAPLCTCGTGGELSIRAQLYVSEAPDNSFSRVEGSQITLTPTVSGSVPPGTVFTGSIGNICRFVDGGTRLMLVFSSFGDPNSVVIGSVSAGLKIATD